MENLEARYGQSRESLERLHDSPALLEGRCAGRIGDQRKVLGCRAGNLCENRGAAMLKQITQEETNRRYIREQTSDRDTRCLRCYYCCKIFEADDNDRHGCPRCGRELIEMGFLKVSDDYDV